MRRKHFQKWFTIFLAVVFLLGTAVPVWADDNGKYSYKKGKKFIGEPVGIDLDEENEDEEIRDEAKDKERERERERVREALHSDQGLKIRLEAELEKETEAGLEEEELPGKKDRPGLQKLIEKLETLREQKPGETKLLHRLAVYYRNLGDYDKAIELCKEILEIDPANQQALVLMALSYRAKGDIEAAIEQLQQLLAENETVGHSVYAYLGILHEARGNLAKAVESVEKAVYLAGGGEKSYRQKLGELYARANVPGLKILIRGLKVNPDVPPFIENGRTMIPVRAVAEALGLEVKYEGEAVVITNPANGKTVTLFIGKQEALVDNEKVTLEAAAKIKGARAFVPLRFVAQGLGASVDYLAEGQVVTVD